MTGTTNAPDGPLYGANPLQALQRYVRRAVVFTGRASRSEYLWVQLELFVIVLLLTVAALGAAFATRTPADIAEGDPGVGLLPAFLLIVLLGLASVLPTISLTVRRLQDAGFTGLLALLWLIPYLGGFVLFILCLLPSSPEGRRFDRGARTAPAGWHPGATAADLAHEVTATTASTGPGPQRGVVAATAARFRATVLAEDDDVDRLVMPDGDVVVRYAPDDQVASVATARP